MTNRRTSGEEGLKQISVLQSRAISQLTSLLRSNGDKILNGQTKLALTTGILTYVNGGFTLIVDGSVDNAFDVQQTSHFKQGVYHDLHCVYDFIQKTLGLKITHGNTTLQGSVNISKFRSLEVLELHKVPIHMVNGLRGLRSRLKTVTCTRCLNKLQDLFCLCGGDMTQSFPWPDLTVAILNYNNIEELDSSLELLPKLEVLDVSHNCLNDLRHIECLAGLRHLNASYNNLETLPTLHLQAQLQIRSLALRNNNLEMLTGLEQMPRLEEVDLGYNCLTHHSQLQPLARLRCLTSLSLDGNPLSYHHQHRELAARHLHPQIADTKFRLDGTTLSRSELNIVKNNSTAFNETFRQNKATTTNNVNTNPEDVRSSAPFLLRHHQRQGSSSSSRSSDLADEFTTSVSSVVSAGGSRRRTARRVREVEISDEFQGNSNKDDLNGRSPSAHLETKEKVEQYRKQFGASWLVANNRLSSPVPKQNNAEGTEQTSGALSNADTSSSIENSVQSSTDASRNELNSTFTVISSLETTTNEEDDDDDDGVADGKRERVKGKPPTLVVEAEVHSVRERSLYSPVRNSAPSLDLSSKHDHDSRFADDENDNFANTFIVQIQRDSNEATLLLTVDDQYLREKDFLTGRTTECLDLRSLLSLEKPIKPPYCVHLSFDYIRKDRRERLYVFEDETSCQAIISLLRPIMERRIVEEMMQGALQCLACGAEFSKDNVKLKVESSRKPSRGQRGLNSQREYLHEVSICPNCGSDMVVELDAAPLPNSGRPTGATATTVPTEKSPTRSPRLARPVHEKPLTHSTPAGSPVASSPTKNLTVQGMGPNSPKDVQMYGGTKASPHDKMMDWQQQRGKMEQMMRRELFCTSSDEEPSTHKSQPRNDAVADINNKDANEPAAECIEQNAVERFKVQFNLRDSSHSRSSTPPNVNRTEAEYQSDLSDDAEIEAYKSRLHVTNPSTMKRTESDITILSNPSQSSISVLSTPTGDQLDSILEASCELHRKHSAPISPVLVRTDVLSPSVRERSLSLTNGSTTLREPERTTSAAKPKSSTGHDSSSSGSGSVCTTYEKSIYDEQRVASPRSHSSNESPAKGTSSESVLDFSLPHDSVESSVYFSTDSVNTAAAEQPSLFAKPSKSEPFLVSDDVSDDAVDSCNMAVPIRTLTVVSPVTMRNSPVDEVTSVPNAKLSNDGSRQGIKYSYDNFSQVDHRIRLHLEMNVFEDGEEFQSILKASVILYGKPGEFIGLLVISTKQFYIFKVVGEEGNEPQKWLRKQEVRPLSHLAEVKLHIGYQGLSLKFSHNHNNSSTYFFLLRDAGRCSKYISYLSDWMKQGAFFSSATYPVIDHEAKDLKECLTAALTQDKRLNGVEDGAVGINIYVMGFYWTPAKDGRHVLEPVSFVATNSHLVLVSENLQWRSTKSSSGQTGSSNPYVVRQCQPIQDLNDVTVSATAPREGKLRFHPEDGDKFDWHVVLDTEFSLQSLIASLKPPWEELYNIELTVSREDFS